MVEEKVGEALFQVGGDFDLMDASVVGLENPFDFAFGEKADFGDVDPDVGLGVDCCHECKKLLHFGEIDFEDRAVLLEEGFAFFLQFMIVVADRAGAGAADSRVGCFLLDLVFYQVQALNVCIIFMVGFFRIVHVIKFICMSLF